MFEQLDELSKLSSVNATYPLIVDMGPTGVTLSLDIEEVRRLVSSTSLAYTAPQLTADVNDFETTGAGVVYLTSDAARSITGVAGGVVGQTLMFVNNGTFPITLVHNSASSTSANRFNFTWAQNLVIPPCTAAQVVYGKTTDQDKWGLVTPGIPNLTKDGGTPVRTGIHTLDVTTTTGLTTATPSDGVVRVGLNAAGAAQTGVVTTGTQTFAGDKSFTGTTATAAISVSGTATLAANILLSTSSIAFFTTPNHDWPLPAPTVQFWEPAAAGDTEVTGMVATGNAHVLIVRVPHTETDAIILKHQNTGSAAANRIVTRSGGDSVLRPGDNSVLVYDNAISRWLEMGRLSDPDETGGGTGQTSYTTGDVLYASASNVLSKLAVGSTGQLLGIASGVPAWTSGTGVLLTHSTTQSVANNTLHATTFDTETQDIGGYHAGGNPTRITIPTDLGGWYVLFGGSDWDGNSTGIRQLAFAINGGLVFPIQTGDASIEQFGRVGVSALFYLAATDYVELIVVQSSGGNLNLNTGVVFGAARIAK